MFPPHKVRCKWEEGKEKVRTGRRRRSRKEARRKSCRMEARRKRKMLVRRKKV